MSGSNEGKPPPEGFFQQIFGSFFRSSDTEKVKKRLLKEIAKSQKKLKTRRYQVKGNLANAGLAKLFFEFYKTLGPTHAILNHAKTSNVLKTILIESSFNKEQLELKEKLSEESIKERANQTESQVLLEELKNELKTLFSFFDASKINEINMNYRLLHTFVNLIHFDYYFLLKKFDSGLKEGMFNYNPRFEAINAQYIVDELKDFLEILPAFDPDADSKTIIDVFQMYRGVEVISKDSWKKILQTIRQLKRTNELQMIVQLIDNNPFYKPEARVSRENIVEAYLSRLKMNTEMILQKIVRERKKKMVNDLATQIFGTASISRLNHYTETANLLFSKKMIGGYTRIAPLNYLKAFLLDYAKKDVRQVVELLIISGKWTDNAPSQMLSESFHQLLNISDELMKFDEALAEDRDYGKKIQLFLYKVERDKQALSSLRHLIKKINEQAGAMILKAGQQCINLANVVKKTMEDQDEKHPKLIINWKELNSKTDKDPKAMCLSVYKKLYYFVKLLKNFV